MRVALEYDIPVRKEIDMRQAMAEGDWSWVWEIVDGQGIDGVTEISAGNL